MDIEAGKTLTNEEVIRELLELLKKNAMKEQANDVFEICSYVDGVQEQRARSLTALSSKRQRKTHILSIFIFNLLSEAAQILTYILFF